MVEVTFKHTKLLKYSGLATFSILPAQFLLVLHILSASKYGPIHYILLCFYSFLPVTSRLYGYLTTIFSLLGSYLLHMSSFQQMVCFPRVTSTTESI